MSNKKTYTNYSKAAIEAVKLNLPPRKAQEKTIEKITDSESARKKGCPKTAFLGLCEEGLVKGIPKRKCLRNSESLNKTYAIDACKLIKANPEFKELTPSKLWKKLNLGTKGHNSQMDVVLALQAEELLILDTILKP